MTTYAMYTTMHRQPDDLRHILATGWEGAAAAADILERANRVFIVGIGTSYHAAQVGEALLRAAGSDAHAVGSFDFVAYPPALRPGDAVIVQAHRGTKHFSARAVERAREAGIPCLAITGRDSRLADDGADVVLRTTPQETSAAYTTSHLGAMAVLAQIATLLGERRAVAETAGWRAALDALPAQIEEVLGREGEVRPIAEAIVAANRRVYCVGAGPNAVTATEAALKARETAYITIDGLGIEQFLHGPIVTLDAADRVIAVAVDGPGLPRTAEICNVIRLIGAPLWIIGRGVASAPDATVFALPTLPEPLSPLLAVVPVQLLAYYCALAKGTNPDTFRRDDPRYLAALSSLQL